MWCSYLVLCAQPAVLCFVVFRFSFQVHWLSNRSSFAWLGVVAVEATCHPAAGTSSNPKRPKKVKKHFGLMGLIWLTVSWIWFVSTWVIPKLMCFVIIIANKIVQIFLEPKAPHEWELKSNCYTWHVTVMKWRLNTVTQLNAECGKPLHPTSACISNAMLLYTP